MLKRPVLDESKRTPAASKAIAAFQSEFVNEIIAEVAKGRVVVVGMKHNPVCRDVQKVLKGAGIDFKYLEHGNYFSGWKKRLAVKLWSGWPTFPQVFVNGVLIGGSHDTKIALADGSFRKILAGDSKA